MIILLQKITTTDVIMRGMAGSSLKFVHPGSLISPANVTEGKTSQAVCSGKGIGAPGGVPQSKVAAKGGPSTVQLKASGRVSKKKRDEKAVFECLEGEERKNQKRAEAELESGDESSSDEEKDGVLLAHRSSSGTTLSDTKDIIDDVDSLATLETRDANDALQGAHDEEQVVLPILKSWDPAFVSPQEPLKETCLNNVEARVVSPIRALHVDGDDAKEPPSQVEAHRSHIQQLGDEKRGPEEIEKEAREEVGASRPKPGATGLPGRKGKSLGIVERKKGEIEDKSHRPAVKPGSQTLPRRKIGSKSKQPEIPKGVRVEEEINKDSEEEDVDEEDAL
jgi:hypothetical protein